MPVTKSSVAAVVAVVAAGGVLVPSSPASAHSFRIDSPSWAGHVNVGWNHYGGQVCGGIERYRVWGEFRMSTLVVHRRSNPTTGGCATYMFGERIIEARACDVQGCTAWKDA